MAGLKLRKDKVGLALRKRHLIDVHARVGFALDASPSMSALYRSGIVQDTFERFFAIATRLDDDGAMDCWPFAQRSQMIETATEANHEEYVRREVGFGRWGDTTRYDPPLSQALNHWFPRRGGLLGFGAKRDRGAVPALLLFLTDGQNNDPAEAKATLLHIQSEGLPLYVSFIGLGDPREFGFIRSVADELDNVGFLQVPDLGMDDDALYEKLVSTELATWLRARA